MQITVQITSKMTIRTLPLVNGSIRYVTTDQAKRRSAR